MAGDNIEKQGEHRSMENADNQNTSSKDLTISSHVIYRKINIEKRNIHHKLLVTGVFSRLIIIGH